MELQEHDGPALPGPPVAWPTATWLKTARLDLEPIRAAHADEAYPWLSDDRIHAFTSGPPVSLEQVRAEFERQAEGHSPDGSQGLLTWMIRHRTGRAVGSVQATVTRHQGGGMQARLFWIVAFDAQGLGFAREATSEMVIWLMSQKVERFVAYIHPRHRASKGIARAAGLHPSIIVRDGRIEWSNDPL